MKKLASKLDFIRNLDDAMKEFDKLERPEQIMESFRLINDYKEISKLPADTDVENIHLEVLKFGERYKGTL